MSAIHIQNAMVTGTEIAARVAHRAIWLPRVEDSKRSHALASRWETLVIAEAIASHANAANGPAIRRETFDQIFSSLRLDATFEEGIRAILASVATRRADGETCEYVVTQLARAVEALDETRRR